MRRASGNWRGTGVRLIAAMAMAIMAGCRSIQVQSDYDPTVSFGAIDTYAWLPPIGPEGGRGTIMDDLLSQRVQRAVNDQLRSKGLELVEPARADLLVAYQMSVEERLDVDTVHYGYRYGRWGYAGPAHTTTYVREYEQGTLVIDLIAPEERRLIWRGVGRTRLRDQATPEQREAHIREVVSAILERYPPEAHGG